MVEDPAPGAEMITGLKLTVAPAGCPEALSEIGELNPLPTVVLMVKVPGAPGVTWTDLGDEVIENPPIAEPITNDRVTFVVWSLESVTVNCGL